MMNNLEKISAENCTDLSLQHELVISTIFNGDDAINAKNLFLSRFNVVPNWIRLTRIDGKKANKWFVQTYQDSAKECIYIKRSEKRKGLYLDDVYFFLFDDLLVNLSANEHTVILLYRKTDSKIVEKIAHEILKFKLKKQSVKPEISLIVPVGSGLRTISMEISKPKISIEENYSDDFLPIHQIILNRLQKKNDKGLILLHGKPGTGKTSYIRYLASRINKKKIIFLPPNMAACITDPGLMRLLIDNPNSVFVIEDAENIIIDRNLGGSSSVSALLNLADGLLSDCLNIQIICSFNTDLSQVDSALMRKGRLIAKYEFKELETHKAQALSNKLGFSSVISSPMTLASIYNQNDMEFSAKSQRRTIGFKAAV
jgi:hypothetical protein